ncbi:MAG TPA: hypothetical protein PKA64_10390 [Myxococcota bacterium]|nr:hypothetical protein [Myxococcota bacterium]
MRTFLFAFVAVGAVACGPKCDSTAYVDKLDECGIDVPDGSDVDVDVECTKELADLVACQDDCVSSADCGAFDGSDLDALTAYGDCVAACGT